MRDVCVDFEPCSMRYSFVSIHCKIIKLGKKLMMHLTQIFHVVLSDY